MPGFNINNFKSHLNATGTLNSSKFLVNIVTPPGMLLSTFNNNGSSTSNFGRQMSDLIIFRADSVRTPGVGLATSNIFRHGIGPSEKKPFNATFSDIGVSFIVDKKADLYVYFYSWLNYIFNFSRGAGGAINANQQNSALASYLSTYKDYYSTDIEIIMYDEAGEKPVQIFRLLKSFPVTISEIPLSWSDRSSLMKLNVSFTYKEFVLDNVNQQTYSSIPTTLPNSLVGVNRQSTSPRPTSPAPIDQNSINPNTTMFNGILGTGAETPTYLPGS